MPSYNELEENRLNMTRRTTVPDYDVWDGMEAAAADTLRTLPISSLARGIQSWTDSSEEISGEEANLEFGFEGEEAYEVGTKVSKNDAAAKAQDRASLASNEMVMGLVNQESPILGRVTQFGASMAAGFADPLLLGLNVGVGMGLAKGIGAFATTSVGRTVQNKLLESSPKLGNLMLRAYDNSINAKAVDYLVRETAENFLGTVAEETINFVGIGEDRLARKVTPMESLQNILIGTTLGTGFGMLLNKGARQAMSKSLSRKYGDDAADVLSSETKIKDIETKLGIEEEGIHQQMLDEDNYDPKEWHVQESTNDVTSNPSEGRYFIPVDEEGNVHTISNRGEGTVLTSNANHAQNKGASVKEIDMSGKKIMTPEEFNGKGKSTPRVRARVVNASVDDLLAGATDEQMTRMMARIIDPDGEIDISNLKVSKVKTQLKRDLKRLLTEAPDLEDMLDHIDNFAKISGVEYDTHRAIDGVLTQHGFDGYSFGVSKHSGEHAYTGLYVKRDSLATTKVINEFSAKPDATHKAKQKMLDQQRLEKYSQSIHERYAKVRKAQDDIIKSNEISENPPMETTVDEVTGEVVEKVIGNEASKFYSTNAHQRAAMDSYREKLQNKRSEGKLSQAEELELDTIEAAISGKDVDKFSEEQVETLRNFQNCLLGTVKETVDG